ncbi:MAG: exonuclease domain-containing protein [Candidatus Omnitrophica bacterium]|nr:exonuclease domain-containing protein [Candidatus Omnitrophota bacterium]
MFGSQSQIIIFDAEYTTWEGALERGWSGPGEHRELVQIGAIRVNTQTLKETDSFEIFIKPSINPILAPYFIELTGITQKIVDEKGISFAIAWQRFIAWMGGDFAYSFGNDIVVIQENCKLFDVPLLVKRERFKNICNLFEKYGINTDQYHSSTIVRAFGKEPRSGAHNALTDARSILDGLILLHARMKSNSTQLF